MCKFYAHHIPCSFQERFNSCVRVHEPLVRDAHDYLVQCHKDGLGVDVQMRNSYLNPQSNLPQEKLDVLEQLLERYPKPPTEEEKKRARTFEQKKKIEATFQQMYGNQQEEDR